MCDFQTVASPVQGIGERLREVLLGKVSFRFYVGNPPVAAPQFNLLTKAEYTGPASVASFEQQVQVLVLQAEFSLSSLKLQERSLLMIRL